MYLLYLYIILVILSSFYHKKPIPAPTLFTLKLILYSFMICMFCEDDYIIIDE